MAAGRDNEHRRRRHLRRSRGLPTWRIIRYADDCVTNADGGCDVEDRDLQMRCCAGDGGMALRDRPAGGGSNHRKLLRLRAVVVSVAEKAHVMRQVGAGKANVSEPLRKASKA